MNDNLDRNQIILALKIIQSECKKHGNCEDTCPFKNGDGCRISALSPRHWDVNDSEKWKALR